MFLVVINIALAVPTTMNIQGELKSSGGTAQTGTFIFKFRIYDAATGGDVLWNETQAISVNQGVYDTILNSINLSFDRQYWLGVTVGSDLEMAPRLNLTSVPYSFRANISDSVKDEAITNLSIDSSDDFSFGDIFFNNAFGNLGWGNLSNVPLFQLIQDAWNWENNASLVNLSVTSYIEELNHSQQVYIDTQDQAQDECSEIAGCVPNADPSEADDYNRADNLTADLGSGLITTIVTSYLTTDNILINKNLYIVGNISNVNVTNVNVNGSLNPIITEQFTLGNSSFRWQSANVSGVVEAGSITVSDIRTANLQDLDGSNFFDLTGCGTSATFTGADETGAITCSGISITESQISDLKSYWDSISDVPTAQPSDGDTTHLSTADQIYDWVISLNYITNTVSTLTNYFTKAEIFTHIGNNITSANASIKSYIDIQDSAQDECSEITGCVENALTSETDPTALKNNSPANITKLRVDSINGTDLALFNKSVMLDDYYNTEAELTGLLDNNYVHIDNNSLIQTGNVTNIMIGNTSWAITAVNNSINTYYNHSIDLSTYVETGTYPNLDVDSTDDFNWVNISDRLVKMNESNIGNISITGNLSVGDNIYVGDSEGDSYIYFYENGNPIEESIAWRNDLGYFIISDAIGVQSISSVGGIGSGGDIYTTGTGDDLYLGTSTQANAKFRAYASGDLVVKDLNATGNVSIIGNVNISEGLNVSGTVQASSFYQNGNKVNDSLYALSQFENDLGIGLPTEENYNTNITEYLGGSDVNASILKVGNMSHIGNVTTNSQIANTEGFTTNTGTVTSITTTAPISGGEITTTGTISLATATPSDGDTTHASTADQIFDYIASLNYITNTVSTLTNYFTKAEIFTHIGNNITSANASINARTYSGNVTGTWNALYLNPCANGEILKYGTTGKWVCSADNTGAGGDTTLLDIVNVSMLDNSTIVRMNKSNTGNLNLSGNFTIDTGNKICFNKNCSVYQCLNKSNNVFMMVNEKPDEVCI